MITSTPWRCTRDGLVHLWLLVDPAPGVRATECELSVPADLVAEDRDGKPCFGCLVTAGERLPVNQRANWD